MVVTVNSVMPLHALMKNVLFKLRTCTVNSLPGNFLFLLLCAKFQNQFHVSSCNLYASKGVTATDVEPDFEMSFDINVGTFNILVVRPFSDKDKIEACRSLNLVKKNSQRLVFMP